MSTERDAALRRRAAVHAALGDAGRLAVVELLAWGDRSPSELSAELAMASNLVAHHVNVLVEAGIVVRRRSEGDRRRTYLSLVTEALDSVHRFGPAVPAPSRVLFVCTANSARSQLAAALWGRASTLPAESAGTHPAARVAPGALRAAQRHRLAGLRTPHTLDAVHAVGDLVVTVCDRAHEETGDLAACHWSVPDPVPSGDDAAFDATIAELERRVADLAPRLTS